jgi:metal-sulfur cluster biosynthetic enzyme
MSDSEKSKVTWDIESTHPQFVEPLRAALGEVMDPEIGLSIIQLGLVRNFRIDKEAAEMTMILTTPFCPYGPALLDMARQKAENVVKGPVEIDLGMEQWDFSMMEEGAGGDWGLY